MPLKLPDPEAGTDEQAGPNGAMAAPEVDAAGSAAADFVVFGVDAAGELLEPQAAAPSASVPAIAATPRNLSFMIFLLSCVGEPLRDAAAEGST
jgi:hypothetical protein